MNSCGSTHHTGCECHEAARDARIRELEAAVNIMGADIAAWKAWGISAGTSRQDRTNAAIVNNPIALAAIERHRSKAT